MVESRFITGFNGVLNQSKESPTMSDTTTQPAPDAPRPEVDTTHPSLLRLKSQYSGKGLKATTYAGDTTIVVPKDLLHEVLQFLRIDPECEYDFLSDVGGIDYLGYPDALGRFCVVYNLVSTGFNRRLFVKVYLDPTQETTGIEHDPALHLPSVCDIWPGAEWNEREIFDMFGIRFDGHPDLRRILTWEAYPGHPLRKDYPYQGRGERDDYRIVTRDSA